MHISEGVLSAPVLSTGAIITAAGTYLGIKNLKEEKIPQAALLSSAFFVASLIHVPVGPSSAHLVLNGLVGILLGWIAFPAILLGLFLKAILFQFGGLTTLGINTVNMALPAVICYYLFGKMIRSSSKIKYLIAGFLTGALGVFLGSIFVAFSLIFTGKEFLKTAKLIVFVHLPIMIIEGLITVFVINFLKKVKPEILRG